MDEVCGGWGKKGGVGCVCVGRVGLMLKGWRPAFVGRKGRVPEHRMSGRQWRGDRLRGV